MHASRVVVIDYGAGHVACGLFSAARGGRLRLRRFAMERVDADPAQEAGGADAMGRALRRLVERVEARADAEVSLAGHLVLAKAVTVPKVEASKLDKILVFEAQQAVPFPLDEVTWDHLTITENGADLEVLLAAVKTDEVERVCGVMAAAGLRVRGVSPSVVSLYRSFGYNYPGISGVVLVADVGARSTTLLLLDGPRLALRTIPLAGNALTQGLAEMGAMGFAQAEALKLERSPDGEAPAVVLQAVAVFAGRLAQEIARSLAAHRRQTGAGQATALYLTGGGSLAPGLDVHLGERLALRVERFNPLRAVEVEPSAAEVPERRALVATLVGAAVVAFDRAPRLTLLPGPRRRAWACRRRLPWLVGGAVATILTIAAPAWHYATLRALALAATREIESRLAPMRRIQGRNTENLTRTAEARARIAVIEETARRRTAWIAFLSDLQDRLRRVDDVWLDTLQVLEAEGAVPVESDGVAKGVPLLRLNVAGRLLDRQTPVSKVSPEAFDRLKTLIGHLKESRFIADVENARFDNTQAGLLRFDFVLVVNPSNPL